MSKLLGYIILAIGLLAGASWLTPALAHVPKVGDVASSVIICTEEAHNVLVEKARADGIGSLRPTLHRFINSIKCSYTMGKEIRVVEVEEPIQTPDGFVLYPLHVQSIDGSKVYFAAHTHKAEGEAI